MAGIPSMPNIPGGGSRAQRAAQLKAETGPKAKEAQSVAEGGPVFRPVKAGETLEDIAAEYDLAPEEIWEHPLNKQLRERRESPDELEEGDALHIPAQAQPKLEPVGQGDYVVKDGECISSIAKDQGRFWETIWNDPANAELKAVRQDPNVLLADDRVTIQALRQKQEPGETEMRHRFVRRGEPAFLRLKILIDGEPRADEPFVLTVDKQEHKGKTDSNGYLEVPVPGNAKEGTLKLGVEEEATEYKLHLGRTCPIDDIKGIQQRLKNLGYKPGPVDGVLGSRTKRSLFNFQKDMELSESGDPDETTRQKLVEEHGS